MREIAIVYCVSGLIHVILFLIVIKCAYKEGVKYGRSQRRGRRRNTLNKATTHKIRRKPYYLAEAYNADEVIPQIRYTKAISRRS